MSDARIHDLGYRRYEGGRRGPTAATVDLALHTIQRVLGLRRQFRHKIAPIIVVALAFIPAVVFVGLAAFLPEDLLQEDILPGYAEYGGIVTFAVVLFASFAAPEAVVTDRRTGMFGLYLAAPLTRTSYTVAKVGAIVAVMLVITTGPQLLMLVAFSIEGAGPGVPFGTLELLVQILAVGILTAAVYASVALALSTLTSRRGIASAVVVLFLLVSTVSVVAFVDAADASPWLYLMNLQDLVVEMGARIYGDEIGEPAPRIGELPDYAVIGAPIAWAVLGGAICWLRIRRAPVTR
ncbi:MAG: ABC transporter permease [Acidimicrobiales bacterium]